MKKKYLLWLLLPALATRVYFVARTPAYTEACLETGQDVVLCAASNMARHHSTAPIQLDHQDFDIRDRRISISAARNESIGFQIIARTIGGNAPADITIDYGDWRDASGNASAYITTELFQAHYHQIDKGGYQWGPKSEVLPWPAAYPDALIPRDHGCAGEKRRLFDQVSIAKTAGQNQSIWLDTYIAADVPAGKYVNSLSITVNNEKIELTVELEVARATLPDTPSIDAVGELYRTYNLEGAGYDRASVAWQSMSHCYQQLAHQHRMVFIERTPRLPDENTWVAYESVVDPMLTGELFTENYGYSGTGKNVPVTIWRTPWPQEFNVELQTPLSDDDFERYKKLASEWSERVTNRGWNKTSFFAYVFDEVDGPIRGSLNEQQRIARRDYLAMVHDQMDKLQQSIDAGSPDNQLDLIWTSHSNPADWQHDPALDLTDKIRLWAPNASAADTDFISERTKAGDTAWFYHSGHPAVGTHSINSSGIEMRTWGVIGARYGFDGQLMWAVNLGSDERPFAEPSYKPDDDRFGNGVMVYPGNQLDKIGFNKVAGPIPSMRLKAWRRGLQDAELYLLAKQEHPQKADELIRKIMPAALADGRGKRAWSSNPSDWIVFRKQILELASE